MQKGCEMTPEEAIYILNNTAWLGTDKGLEVYPAVKKAVEALKEVEKHKESFEWCTDCKEYDKDNHCCHRWTKRIRDTVSEMKSRFSWHNLRKNPDDLPEKDKRVEIVLAVNNVFRNAFGTRVYDNKFAVNGFITSLEVAAWRDIEQFVECEDEQCI